MRMIGRFGVMTVSAVLIQWAGKDGVAWWLAVLMVAAGLWGIEWTVLDRKKEANAL